MGDTDLGVFLVKCNLVKFCLLTFSAALRKAVCGASPTSKLSTQQSSQLRQQSSWTVTAVAAGRFPSSRQNFFSSQFVRTFGIRSKMPSAATPLDSVQACWARISQHSPVYSFFFSDISIESAEYGSMVATLRVGPNHLNSKGGLHGSVSATIVDWAGGMAIASTGLEKTGVSTDIHVTYASSAKLGDVLTIEGKTSRVGKNMGFTTVTIYKGVGEEKVVVAHGTHTKYILRDQLQSKAS